MQLRSRLALFGTAAAVLAVAPGLPAHADQIRDSQWFVGYLKLPRAHQISKGSGVTVAVVDSGITAHTDIAKNLRLGTDTVLGGDGLGQVDDKDGHGTKMAGLIAGHGRNAKDGVLGIAPEAQLVPIKSVGVSRSDDDGVTSGIKWAVESGADVINISVTTPRSRSLDEAVAMAIGENVLIIAAAGNNTESPRLAYPAAFPDVLTVGATDRKEQHAKFSITSPEIDICAPGVDMVTTFQKNDYYKGNGTSEATAVVSGAAALVRAKFPELSAPEVIHRLTATATDNGPPGRDDQCGFGVLDIVKALTADVPPLDPSGSTGPTAPSGSSSPVNSSAPAGNGSSADAVSPSEPPGSDLPVIAGIGAAVVGIGVVLALVVRRRRSSPPESPTQEARPAE